MIKNVMGKIKKHIISGISRNNGIFSYKKRLEELSKKNDKNRADLDMTEKLLAEMVMQVKELSAKLLDIQQQEKTMLSENVLKEKIAVLENKMEKLAFGEKYQENLNHYILAKWNLEGITAELKEILEYHRFSINILDQRSRLIYISCFLEEGNRDLAIVALKDYIRDFGLEEISDLMPVAALADECGYLDEKIKQSANIFRAFQRNNDSKEFENYVLGKSIAIVGNSPEIIGMGQGGEIDGRDIVVRMNSFVLKDEYLVDTGCKTNIFVDNSNNGVIKCRNHRKIEEFEWTFLPYDITHIFISQFCNRDAFLQSWDFIVKNKLTKMVYFPAEHSISLKKELKTISPSAGIITIWYFYRIRGKILETEIFGFNSKKRGEEQEKSDVKETMAGEIEDLNFFFDTIDQSSFFKSAPIYEVSHNFNEELIFRKTLYE